MKISNEVIDILVQCTCDGNKLHLPDFRLDRKLYIAVNKVLELAGLKWSRKEKAHVSDDQICDLIDTLIFAGEITDIRKELQYFPTPDSVMSKLFELAELSGSTEYLCLEPSAGLGAIASRLLHYGNVDCCEINPDFHNNLTSIGCDVVSLDFLQHDPEYKYDVVIANPPFTRQQDIDHVNKMLDLCSGRVVSVMSAGVLFRSDHKATTFRKRIRLLDGHFVELPEGSFKESGTMVNTCVVVADCN